MNDFRNTFDSFTRNERNALSAKRIRHTTGPKTPKQIRRVLFVSEPSAYSGAEESCALLAESLDRSRYAPIMLVGAEGYFTDRLRKASIEVVIADRPFSETVARNIMFVQEFLKQYDVDLVHLNSPWHDACEVASRLQSIPVISHLRVFPSAGCRLERFDAVIAVSEAVRQAALSFGACDGRVHTVYNGIGSSNDSAFERSRVALDEIVAIHNLTPPVILSVARISPEKRLELLVDAAGELRPTFPTVTVVVAGETFDATYAQRLHRLVEQSGLTNVFRFVGFQKNLLPFYQSASVVVLCSEREPFGRVMLESFRYGVPVVATRGGGTDELVTDGVSGLLADPAGLASKIELLLRSGELRERLVGGGHAVLQGRFSLSDYSEDVMRIYDNVLAEASRARSI